MKRIGFYLFLPILLGVSLLPFPILYLLSDFLFFLIYRVIGYRKKVVYFNLKRSFPHLEERELYKIRKDFYKHLTDLILEALKAITISKSQIVKRVSMKQEYFDEFNTKYKDTSVIFLLGHYGNWEWANLFSSIQMKHRPNVVYHPLKNIHFDYLIAKMRGKFGAHLSSMKDAFRNMVKLRDQLIATCLVADQNPSPHTAFWTEFLSQQTPFFRGPAKLSQKLNQPIFYISIKKTKRGYYSIAPIIITEQPKDFTEEEILSKYIQLLEADIIKNPAYWLWSHRRWKHKYKDYHSTSL